MNIGEVIVAAPFAAAVVVFAVEVLQGLRGRQAS